MKAKTISVIRPDFPVRASAGQAGVAEVTAAVNAVTEAFAGFKAANEKRVGELEGELKDMNARFALARRSGGGSIDGAFSAEELNQRETFAQFCRGKLGVHAAMTTDSNPDGGYLVPEQVERGIGRLAIDLSPMRRLARVVTTTTGVYKKIVSLNGVVGSWTTEKAARPETQGMRLSELSFPVSELTAMPAVSQTLLDDADVDLAGDLSFEIAQAFQQLEGAAFIAGDGANKPRGILAQTLVANSSYAWGKVGFLTSGVSAALSDASHNGIDRLNSLLFTLKAEYRRNATWLMNSTTASVISQLKDGNDNYLWQPPVQLGMPATLYGRPVELCEDMPDIGADKFPIAIGDWQRAYLIVDRIGIRLLRDPYSSKPYVLFYTTKRVGGGVQDFGAYKLLKIAA